VSYFAMQFVKKCMTLGPKERKKEKIELQKKNFHLSIFSFLTVE